MRFEADQGRSGASTPVFLDLLIMVSRCLIAGEKLQRDSPGAVTGLR